MATQILEVDSDLSAVPGLAARLTAACAAMGLSGSDASVMEICVVEAVNNAIEHAYRGLPGRAVRVALALRGTSMVAKVHDTGAVLPPERLAAATLHATSGEDLSAFHERGMGLAIMKDAMDEVVYSSEHGLNTLMLSKQIVLSGQHPHPTSEEQR
jgi:serine/threonine-protein kinase RsbW